jgi:hypothetical protein
MENRSLQHEARFTAFNAPERVCTARLRVLRVYVAEMRRY